MSPPYVVSVVSLVVFTLVSSESSAPASVTFLNTGISFDMNAPSASAGLRCKGGVSEGGAMRCSAPHRRTRKRT